jgi:hypothetical protein
MRHRTGVVIASSFLLSFGTSVSMSSADSRRWTEAEEEGMKFFFVEDDTNKTSLAMMDCYIISNRSMVGLEVSINDLLKKRSEDQTEYWLNVNFTRNSGKRDESSQLYAYASFEYLEFLYFFASKTLVNPHLETEFKSLSVCKRPIEDSERSESCISFTTRGLERALKATCQKKRLRERN